LRVRNRVATSLAEHGEIIAAIRAGDGDRAEGLLRAHITVQGERFADLVASLEGWRVAGE
jgi:DNA-binding GntR family transcriptional regulator